MANNLGIVFLLLVILLVSCSIDHALASPQPQELLPLTEWRRMLIRARSSTSQRARKRDIPPSPSPSSPPSSSPSPPPPSSSPSPPPPPSSPSSPDSPPSLLSVAPGL